MAAGIGDGFASDLTIPFMNGVFGTGIGGYSVKAQNRGDGIVILKIYNLLYIHVLSGLSCGTLPFDLDYGRTCRGGRSR